MAAPHVAGTAALLMALGLTNCSAQKSILLNTDPTSWADGTGRLNAGKALSPATRKLCGTHDVGNYRPSDGAFQVSVSTGSSLTPISQWSTTLVGNANDTRFIADYDGNGKADVGNYRPSDGAFQVSLSTGSSLTPISQWSTTLVGNATDTRFIADYDGNGKADVGNYAPSAPPPQCTGRFQVSLSTGSSLTPISQWSSIVGCPWEVRYIGNYNDDGKADVGNYVPGNGQFWVSVSTGSSLTPTSLWSTTLVGNANDTRFIANFDGQ